jgi:nucleoredoxin
MKTFAATITLLVCLSMPCLKAQTDAPTNPAPASDDPSADLKSSGSMDSSDSSTDLTGFAATFHGHLMVLEDGKTKSFDSSTLQNVKYVAFYYSASWCAPCRAFTPKLVDFYKEFKAQHPNFELIFVCHDHDESAMVNYMKTDGMTWPAVRFSDISNSRLGANKYCGSGIPDLVLVDENGKVLSDSFNG